MAAENYFIELNKINCNGKVETKNGLSYLSWAWAWTELKKRHPSATYEIFANPSNGMPYFTDGKTGMVHTAVTVDGITHDDWLPIMDNRNKSIATESITSFEVNKAIQRSLTKAVARHGIGLYIYAGEDLPESETDERYNDSVTTGLALVDVLELPSDVERILEGIGILEKVKDSDTVIKNALKAKMKEKHITYNKETKTYEWEKGFEKK